MSDDKHGGPRTDQLEAYKLLAKDSSGARTVMIIGKVLKDPSIFVFGELLALPSVQDLDKTAEHKPWLDVLKLFAYGTYNDYKAKSKETKLPELGVIELKKLKLLTIVTAAGKSKIIPYSTLMSELEIANVRELEDLIIDAIYNQLIEGALDQKTQALHVGYAIGRDLGPKDVNEMIKMVQSWLASTDNVMKTLQRGIDSSLTLEKSKKSEETDIENERKSQIEAIKLQQKDDGNDERKKGNKARLMQQMFQRGK